MRSTPDSRDNVLLAIPVILLTVFSLSLGDALVKLFSNAFPLWQIFVVRSLVAIPVLIAIMRLSRVRSWRPKDLRWTALRSLMLTFMWIAYYAALAHVELSVAAAVWYTLPLFVTLFAALFIGEPVGLQGWGAVGLGFCGVLLILRPDTDAFNAYALLPLASAILYAMAMILTRTKCRDEHPLVLSLALNASFIVVGGAASLFLWARPTAPDGFVGGAWIAIGPAEWLALSIMAAAILIGSIGAAYAYQKGPSSIISTFDFAYLAFAAGWGYAFFGETPNGAAMAGIAAITVAGILTVTRKSR